MFLPSQTGRTVNKDIAATNEFAVNVELRYCWPITARPYVSDTSPRSTTSIHFASTERSASNKHVRELLDALPQYAVLQHVERLHLFGGDAMDAQHLYGGTREAALGRVRRAFHEEHYGRPSHGLLDLCADIFVQEPPRDAHRRRAERGRWHASWCTQSGELKRLS